MFAKCVVIVHSDQFIVYTCDELLVGFSEIKLPLV